MEAEVGFEPTGTFWILLAYETRELDQATLLRDLLIVRDDVWTLEMAAPTGFSPAMNSGQSRVRLVIPPRGN